MDIKKEIRGKHCNMGNDHVLVNVEKWAVCVRIGWVCAYMFDVLHVAKKQIVFECNNDCI